MTYPPHTRTLFRGPEHWKATQCLREFARDYHHPNDCLLGEEQEYVRCFKEDEEYIVRGYNLPALEELS